MLILYFTLPLLLFLLARVSLVDPREPTDKPSRLGLFCTILAGSLPVLFYWAPHSAIYNASLALALSVVLTPLLFGAMKTDGGAEWVRDKLFLAGARTIFAAILAVPLTFLRSWWFLVLGTLALFSFLTRLHLWVLMGGNPKKYVGALLSALFIVSIYYVMVVESRITPHTWTDWRNFLAELSH